MVGPVFDVSRDALSSFWRWKDEWWECGGGEWDALARWSNGGVGYN